MRAHYDRLTGQETGHNSHGSVLVCARVPWRTIGESRTPVTPPVTTHPGARASGYATLYLWVKLGVFAACLSYGPSLGWHPSQPLGNFSLEPILEGVVLDTAEPHPKVDPMQAGLEPGKAKGLRKPWE